MTNTMKNIGLVIAGVIVGLLFASVSSGLGGVYSNVQKDFSEGISVDGTVVIDGSGNVDAPITSSTGTFSSTVTVSGDATFDTDTLFVDVSTNRVGVGTTTPSQTLHVANTPLGDGTNASTTIKFGAATTTSRTQFEMQQDDGGTSCVYVNTAGTAFVVQTGACN